MSEKCKIEECGVESNVHINGFCHLHYVADRHTLAELRQAEEDIHLHNISAGA